jgi:hypothetical protein
MDTSFFFGDTCINDKATTNIVSLQMDVGFKT